MENLKKLQINTSTQAQGVFDNYPDLPRKKLVRLRELILETASEIEEINELEETLKWGEPSYVTKIGSTIRIDWKEKNPDQYAMYFKCTSKLVPTFRATYDDLFEFEGNRAIVFNMEDPVPEEELKQCIKAALMYHKVKDLPFLSMA